MTNNKYDLLILDYGGVYSFEYDVANFDKIMQSSFGKVPNQKEKEEISAVTAHFSWKKPLKNSLTGFY
jgi:hypothetical protein